MHQTQFTDYDALRAHLRTGDIVAMYREPGLKGWFAEWLFRFFGMGRYCHLAMVRCESLPNLNKSPESRNMRVWAIEERAGVGGHLQPLSHFKHRAFDVYALPQGMNAEVFLETALSMTDRLLHFSMSQMWEFAWIGIKRATRKWVWGYFGKGGRVNFEKDALVCSTYVYASLVESGWHGKPDGLWPTGVIKALGNQPRLSFTPAGRARCNR